MPPPEWQKPMKRSDKTDCFLTDIYSAKGRLKDFQTAFPQKERT
jgi:hypothetical protein